MLNISQVIIMRTDSNLCRKERLTPLLGLLSSLVQTQWGGGGDESEAVAPIIWLYQIVDAQKEEVFFPDLLIILQSYVFIAFIWYKVYVQSWHNIWSRLQILGKMIHYSKWYDHYLKVITFGYYWHWKYAD